MSGRYPLTNKTGQFNTEYGIRLKLNLCYLKDEIEHDSHLCYEIFRLVEMKK